MDPPPPPPGFPPPPPLVASVTQLCRNRVLTVCRSRKGGSGRGISRATGPLNWSPSRTAVPHSAGPSRSLWDKSDRKRGGQGREPICGKQTTPDVAACTREHASAGTRQATGAIGSYEDNFHASRGRSHPGRNAMTEENDPESAGKRGHILPVPARCERA